MHVPLVYCTRLHLSLTVSGYNYGLEGQSRLEGFMGLFGVLEVPSGAMVQQRFGATHAPAFYSDFDHRY